MRGVDLPAKIRTIERILGLEIEHAPDLRCFFTKDPLFPDSSFAQGYANPSDAERGLKQLHSQVYRARGQRAYNNQRGKCAMCGEKMPPNEYEVDHKHGRGRGRSDRLEDIQAVCTGFNGCDLHRRKHGG